MNKKILWRIVLWLNWVLIVSFWFSGSRELLSLGVPSLAVALGRLAGLSAAYMILLQFFFMGRTPWLERVFGLDTLSRMHHTNGKWGLVVLLFHPVLLTFGYSRIAGISNWHQFTTFLTDYEHVLLAFIGLMLFLVVVGTSIFIVRSRMRYESWYFVHLAAYLAVFFSYLHQTDVGGDFVASSLFTWYWVILYSLVFVNHAIFRFVRPVYNFYRHRFYVSRLVRENYNTVSIYFRGNNLEKFNIHPGQFMIVRFLTKGMWWQAHPFSLSMVPGGTELRITVKQLGDFTKALNDIPTDTKVIIDGPYGVFTDLFGFSQKALLIAGGIGITPIRSLMEEMLKKGKDVVLLYANRTQKDIVFKEELAGLEERYRGKIVHILSDEPGFEGQVGQLNQEKIQGLVPDISDRDVYLCGPVPMMNALIPALTSLGVTKQRLHYEKFSLA